MPRCSVPHQWDGEKGTRFCSPSHKVKTHMAHTVKPEAAKQQESLFNTLDQRNSHWCDQAGNLHTGTGRLKTVGQKAEVVDGDTRRRKWPGFRQDSKIGKSGNRKSLCQAKLESLACETANSNLVVSECVEGRRLSSEPVVNESGKIKSWRGVWDTFYHQKDWRRCKNKESTS